MPIFLKIYGLTFFSLIHDLIHEPFHLHVAEGNNKLCKYWIFPDGSLELAESVGYKRAELKKIEKALKENITFVIKRYKTYCHENDIGVNFKTKHKEASN